MSSACATQQFSTQRDFHWHKKMLTCNWDLASSWPRYYTSNWWKIFVYSHHECRNINRSRNDSPTPPVCSLHSAFCTHRLEWYLIIGYSFGCLRGNYGKYCGVFCVKLKFGSWTLRKVRRAQASPTVLTVKIGLGSWGFFVDLSDVCSISRELMVWFLSLFYHNKCINLELGLFP